ncbi:hypothetical protein N9Z86_00045 [bacterium]|nr:hypothetical protein [bacterium]
MAKPEELKKQIAALKEEFELLDDTFKSIGQSLRTDIGNNLGNLSKESQGIVDSLGKDLTQAINRSNKSLADQSSLLNQIQKGKNVSRNIEKEISKIEKERDTILRKANVIKRIGGKIEDESIETLKEGLNIQIDNLNTIQGVNDEAQKQVGLFGLASNNLGEIANQFDKSGTLSKLLSSNFKEVLTLTRLTQASFLLLVKGAFEASSNIANIAKNTGLSATAARDLQINFAFAAANSEKLFLTSKDLNKSFLELSSQTGLIADFGGQTLVTQSTLTKQLGLSAEQAGNLSLLSRLQSEDTEGVLDNTVNTVGALVKQSGVAVNVKSILEEISNTSAAITVSLGKNPEELAKAAVQAKLFGANLETVDGIASSLLNFEESIQNELEAELLIGKDINLEKARLLALNNDLAGLSAELAGQEEIINAFATGNRIQQEAAAKALGMSREELAKISLQQDYNNLSAETFKDTYGDITYQQLQSQSAGEKFASILEKIQGVVGDIGIAFSPFLDGVAKLAGFFAASKVAAAALIGVLTTLAALSIASSIATIFKSALFAGPFVGPVLAGAITAGMLASIGTGIAMATADDMVSTGYGDRILSTPKGSIALNNQDTVVAGTNLGGGNNESKRTNQLLERILTKQGTVNIDSTKAGTAFAMGTYQVQ